MAGGAIGLVKELRHPILKSLLSKDVITFRSRYNSYTRQIDELNAQRSASNQLKPTEFQHCIEAVLLKGMLALKLFDEFAELQQGQEIEAGDLTHEIVEAWIDDRAKVVQKDVASRVSMALSEVKYKPSRADPIGATTMFFTDILQSLEEHGCQSVPFTSGKELAKQIMPLI